MTLFESYCQPQEKEATHTLKHPEKEKLLAEAFLFHRSRKQQFDELQVTSVLSECVALCVCCALSQTIRFKMFTETSAGLHTLQGPALLDLMSVPV